MYGLALFEMGWFVNESTTKKIVVERQLNKAYVSINDGCAHLSNDPNLEHLEHLNVACATVLCIYLMTGSDYVSSFFRMPSRKFVSAFMKYAHVISPANDPLVKVVFEEGKPVYQCISEDHCMLLITYTYLEKHLKLFSHKCKDVHDLKTKLEKSDTDISGDLYSLLEWLGYNMKEGNVKVTTMQEWVDFTQRVCFFQETGSADLHKLIVPSYQALQLHISRTNFVMKLAIESCLTSPTSFKCFGPGWFEKNNDIYVKWEDDVEKVRKDISTTRKSIIKRYYCKSC